MTCPSCAEALPQGAPAACPACGEPLPPPAPSAPSRAPAVAIVTLVVLLSATAVGVGLVAPAYARSKVKSARLRCGNHQRTLALAALQYADDKRFFPHLGGVRQLDGDVTTSDSTRIVRTLVWHGYHDAPDAFVCPASADRAQPVLPQAKRDPRVWFWGGALNPASGLPPIRDGQPDPPLDRTTELSYGWTRRAISAGSRGLHPLLADRARRDPAAPPRSDALRGNHEDGWNVTLNDGSVDWTPRGGGEARLAAASGPGDGCLAIDPPE